MTVECKSVLGRGGVFKGRLIGDNDWVFEHVKRVLCAADGECWFEDELVFLYGDAGGFIRIHNFAAVFAVVDTGKEWFFVGLAHIDNEVAFFECYCFDENCRVRGDCGAYFCAVGKEEIE